MKTVWVKTVPWSKEIAMAAIECGADALWIEPGKTQEVKKMGLIQTVAEDGDLKLGFDVVEKEIREKKDEEEIITLSLSKKVVVRDGDWKIIPLENLLSRTNNLFVEIDGVKEGQTALSVLEKGVDGVVINNPDPNSVRHIIKALKESIEEAFQINSRNPPLIHHPPRTHSGATAGTIHGEKIYSSLRSEFHRPS